MVEIKAEGSEVNPEQEVIEHRIVLLPGQAALLADMESDVLAAIAGCVGGGTLIETVEGRRPIKELLGFNEVLTLTERGIESIRAFIFLKGKAQLYRLTLRNGKTLEATADHYLLVSDGQTVHWSSVGELLQKQSGQEEVSVVLTEPSRVSIGEQKGCLPDLQQSIGVSSQSVHFSDVPHCWGKAPGCPGHYSGDWYLYDGQLHWIADNDQAPFPLLAGVPEYSRWLWRMDEMGTLRGHIPPYQLACRPSRNSLVPSTALCLNEGCCVSPLPYERSQGLSPEPVLSHKLTYDSQTPNALDGLFQSVSNSYDVPYQHFQSLLYANLVRIASIVKTTISSYYDMVVPEYHNYLAEGMVHHNTGSGKTQLMYWWLHNRMETYPGYTWLVAEPTFNLLSKVLLTSSDPDRPSLEGYFKMVGHHPEYHAVDKILQTDFGQIYLGSADNPDSMQGAAVRGACLDEAGLMLLRAYETARQRCSMMNGQLLITTTPYNLGWLLTEVKNRAGTHGIHVETWRSIDRPGYPRERYEREKAVLPPWRFAMLYDAQFERPTGMIYSAFNESCVIDRFEIPKTWLIYVGHDFGADNPSAVFYAQDPATGQFYLFQEYLPGAGTSVYERVEVFKKITKGYNVVWRVGGAPGEEEARQAYNAHGWIITAPKIGHVEPQIDKVIGLHQLNKIMVFRDMEHYLDEKRTFTRELDEDNQVTERILHEGRFHLMAAERYLLSNFTPETAASDSWNSNRSMRI